MVRSSIGSVLGVVLLVAVVTGQAPDRPEASGLEAQREQLRGQIAEIESKIAELEARRAKLSRQLKIEDRLAEIRGTNLGITPPLLFPPGVERAMLQDGQQTLPRQLKLNPFELPQKFDAPQKSPAIPRR
jgi:hypothetical protein